MLSMCDMCGYIVHVIKFIMTHIRHTIRRYIVHVIKSICDMRGICVDTDFMTCTMVYVNMCGYIRRFYDMHYVCTHVSTHIQRISPTSHTHTHTCTMYPRVIKSMCNMRGICET